MTSPPKRPRVVPFRAEREFGLLVGAILALLGGWWTYREKFAGVRLGFAAAGLLLLLLGAAWPRALALPYKLWMGLAEQIARVVTTLILGVVFFLVVTPIGLLKRLRGWDPLERRALAGGSFWRPYEARQLDPKHFDRMY